MTGPPEPLVPAEVDLRDFSFMPLDVRRLLTSETWMLGTGDERAAAMCLWLESWHQVPAASLPNNERILAHLSQCSRWPKVREHALRGWVLCSDGRLYHPVVAQKAMEAWEHKKARRARTEAARMARQQQRQSQTTYENVTFSVTENVTGSKGQGQGQGQGQGHINSKASLSGKPDPAPLGHVNGHSATARKLLEFLNEKTGRRYQPVAANLRLIVCRLKEGATEQECRQVIAKKCREWMTDEKMALYLRPATLFAAKNFAQYQGELGHDPSIGNG